MAHHNTLSLAQLNCTNPADVASPATQNAVHQDVAHHLRNMGFAIRSTFPDVPRVVPTLSEVGKDDKDDDRGSHHSTVYDLTI